MAAVSPILPPAFLTEVTSTKVKVETIIAIRVADLTDLIMLKTR
jgi:hypothetical protein